MTRAARLIVPVLTIAAHAACGGSSSSPGSPSPTPGGGSSTSTYVVTGTLSATNGGQPLPNITIATSSETVATHADGAFELHAQGAGGSLPVSISGSSIITRTTTLDASIRSGNALNVFVLDGSFDQGFYRQFARNGYEQPGRLQPIRRWTKAPQIYMKTVDEAGQAVDSVTLDSAAAALADAADAWMGGQFALAGITKGKESREGASGWITVKWANPPATGRCGLSTVGVEGGSIELNYLGATCSCGGPSRVYPRLVRHELGHALGYYHTDSPNDVMYGQEILSTTCNLQPSARERQYAKYVYSRPVGNTDPDNDPSRSQSASSLPTIVQR
jgi:hypothetical protein